MDYQSITIRKTILLAMQYRRDALRAVAFLVWFRHKNNNGTQIHNYTVNQIANITKCHSWTVKKHIAELEKMNLIEYRDGDIIFKSIKSGHTRRNLRIARADFSSLTSLQDSIYAFFLVQIKQHMIFAASTIRTATDGHDLKKVKAAKKLCRKYGYGTKFIDNGISFTTIARRLKIGRTKAAKIIKLAVENLGLLIKTRHYLYEKIVGIGHREVLSPYSKTPKPYYTYTTKNYGYKVFPNSYALTGVQTC